MPSFVGCSKATPDHSVTHLSYLHIYISKLREKDSLFVRVLGNKEGVDFHFTLSMDNPELESVIDPKCEFCVNLHRLDAEIVNRVLGCGFFQDTGRRISTGTATTSIWRFLVPFDRPTDNIPTCTYPIPTIVLKL